MKTMVAWAARNGPSVNTLVIALLTIGIGAALSLRREEFPQITVEQVMISVAYPGASPTEIEAGICQKIEEAIRTVDGVKKILSVSSEGRGVVLATLYSNVDDVQVAVNDLRSAVDRIPSFPEFAEKAEVRALMTNNPVMQLAVVGPNGNDANSKWQLRQLVERVRNDLVQLPSVSQVIVAAAPSYQIDVEIPESTLRKHGLRLRDVAQAIRRENVELPAGQIKTENSAFLLRGTNRRLFGSEIAKLPVLTGPGNVVLSVDDLGDVVDGFEDSDMSAYFDGRPTIPLRVGKTPEEDAIEICQQVRDYVDQNPLPPGYELLIWYDGSAEIAGRLNLVARGGLFGLLLVFLALSLFLNIRLAFWVALGIPVAVLGTCAVLFYGDQTLNQVSTFAFVMALGIVVDDAIVIGENVYTHLQRGKSRLQAAIDGTLEVAPSVIASVLTTVIAFIPMLFVAGILGKFIAIFPMAIISMLLISLFESLFILPCHLAHARFQEGAGPYSRLRRAVDRRIRWVIEDLYAPTLRWLLKNQGVAFSASAAALLLMVGLVQGGFTPFVMAPQFDGELMLAGVAFPAGTPTTVTEKATETIEQAVRQIGQEYEIAGKSLVRTVVRTVGANGIFNDIYQEGGAGGNIGYLYVRILPAAERPGITSQEVMARWRERVGEIPGTERLLFQGSGMGLGGKPIEFKLLGDDLDELTEAVAKTKEHLATYPGVFDVRDETGSGRWEMRLKIKPKAQALGIDLEELASTVRASYYGEEVMRLQRGRHEVKLMVRYPEKERHSLARFEEIRLRTQHGAEIPLTELAEREILRAPSEIVRLDQRRAITITANLDDKKANAREIAVDLNTHFLPALFEEHPGTTVRWEGDQEESEESFRSLLVGFAVALLGIYLLLTIQFHSYLQPLIILAVIPFGAIGAVLGHLAMGLPLTLFTIFGMVGLSGVVVNDSIVLIDFINRRRGELADLHEALIQAGSQRFRPVLLTSITTIVGLSPILLERSVQAEILIPMATSMAFGLALATVWILLLVPVMYGTYANLVERWSMSQADVETDRITVEASDQVVPLAAPSSS